MLSGQHTVNDLAGFARQTLSLKNPRRLALFVLVSICLSFLLLTSTSSSAFSVTPASWSLPEIPSLSDLSRKLSHQPNLPPGVYAGPYIQYHPSKYWHGWSNVSHMFVFGDSWTMIDFHYDGELPSAEDPFGNPGWPGITSTAGPNWVGYITYKFNDSLVLTADFAVGGATVDFKLIRQGVPHFGPSDLNAQVNKHFGGSYVNNASYEWAPESTLFALWMGINDIHEQDNSTEHYFVEIFELFARRVDDLYHYGARNFLFLNVPPLERAPLATTGNGERDRLEKLVSGWNRNLTDLVWNLTSSYDDVSAFLFNTYDLYEDVLADPCIMPQTCGMKVLEGYCPKYAFAWYFEDPACPYHVDKYFWLNDFHPTSAVHNVTGAALAQGLRAASPR